MTHFVAFQGLKVALLVILLGWAIVVDVRSRRIPNLLVVTGLVGVFAVSGAEAAFAGDDLVQYWKTPLFGMVAGFFLMLPLHLLRAMGAGDVKLMAMVGAFIGAGPVVWAALCTLIAGGVLSLVYMLGRGVATQTLGNVRALLFDWTVRIGSGQGIRVSPLENTAVRLPYALAIALGTLASLLWPWPGT
jgi:prepilin peptidase CpaA